MLLKFLCVLGKLLFFSNKKTRKKWFKKPYFLKKSELFNQGVGAIQGGMHVIIPHMPTPIPNPARHEHTSGGTPNIKQPPTLPAWAVIVPPTSPKQAAQAIGPD